MRAACLRGGGAAASPSASSQRRNGGSGGGGSASDASDSGGEEWSAFDAELNDLLARPASPPASPSQARAPAASACTKPSLAGSLLSLDR
jgi:hypothetical protein